MIRENNSEKPNSNKSLINLIENKDSNNRCDPKDAHHPISAKDAAIQSKVVVRIVSVTIYAVSVVRIVIVARDAAESYRIACNVFVRTHLWIVWKTSFTLVWLKIAKTAADVFAVITAHMKG